MAVPPGQLHVYHTFKRYSLGSTAVTQWLCVNAESCGQKLFPPKPTTKSGQKKAKQKAKSHPGVPISEYLTLAKVIAASSEPQIEVPIWILELLSDMIAIRKICTERFKSSATRNDHAANNSNVASSPGTQENGHVEASQQTSGVENLKEENERLERGLTGGSDARKERLQAICILEEALHLLATRQVKCDSDAFAPFSEEHTLQDRYVSKNPYERLFPDEPVKAGQHWQEESSPLNPLFKPSKDREYEILMVQCLFEDFYSTRKFLRQCWEAYQRKETDLYAVSVITNTAMQFLIGMMNDLEVAFPERTQDYILLLPLAAQWMDVSTDVFDPFIAHSIALEGESMDSSVWETAEQICLPAYSILAEISDRLRKSYTFFTGLSFGDVPPETARGPVEKYTQSRNILYQLFAELIVLLTTSDARGSLPYMDILTHGLLEMIPSGNIPNWLPLACTVYLDTHRALGANLQAGQNDLQLSCARIRETIENHLDQSNAIHLVPEHIPPPKKIEITDMDRTRVHETGPEYVQDVMDVDENMAMIVCLVNHVLFIEKDSMNLDRATILKNLGAEDPKVLPFRLFKIHPLLCGVIEFNFTLRMQRASIGVMNDYGAVASVVHLYSAIHNEMPGGEFALWPDMERLVWLHLDDIGGKPRNASEILHRYEEIIGFKGIEFGTPLPPGSAASQTFKPKSEIYKLLLDQYCELGNLESAKFKDAWSWTKRMFLTPERLCTELALCLQSEFEPLKFNYLKIHTRCLKILHAIHLSLDEDLTERFGQGYISQRKQQLPFIAGYLLTDLCMHESVKEIRQRRQQVHRIQHGVVYVPNGAAYSEHYEPARGNNEVYECDSVHNAEVDEYEDYDSRDPACPVVVPIILHEAARIMDDIVSTQGDWEHRELQSIKNPEVENPAKLGTKARDPKGLRELLQTWMEC